jgi:hypothetical protein
MPIYFPASYDVPARELYSGRVLEDREENWHDDSDWYAIVLADDGALQRVDYATTRYGGSGSYRVDATDEVKIAARAWLKTWARKQIRRAVDLDSKIVKDGRIGNGIDVISDYTCGNESFRAHVDSFDPEDWA